MRCLHQETALFPVNNYTGIPSISLPLYNYSSQSGLSLNLSLDYFAGGIRTAEQPSTAGIGWNINVGAITRTIRGVADDVLGRGFLYTPTFVQEDGRNQVYEYQKNCMDAEQDIFQYNVNGVAGVFYIGRNKKIITSPGSHVRFSVEMDPNVEEIQEVDQVAGIHSFTMITDAGVKYIFDNIEYQTSRANACGSSVNYKLSYGSAWYVSKIIAPYSTDTIVISYISYRTTFGQINPQTHTINTSNVHSQDTLNGSRVDTIAARVPSRINFPDSTHIDLLYNTSYLQTPTLKRIKVSDTAFQYGYMFKRDTSVAQLYQGFLLGVNYYTTNHITPGYTFTYNPLHPLGIDEEDLWYYKSAYKKDHWGFYNALNNTNAFNIVPSLSGAFTGADRTTNANAVASTISSVTDPSGGTTFYKFENNDILPVTNSLQSYTVDGSLTSSIPVTLNRAHSNFYNFRLSFNNTFYRAGTSPIGGNGLLTFSITNSAGTIIYFTTNINLRQMFYNGSAIVGAAIPNGSYQMKVSLSGGTTSSTSLPMIINFFNQTATGGTSVSAGGVRIKQITHFDPLYNKTDTLVTYRYITADGKSSGMGGQIPIYDFVTYAISGTTTITATADKTNIVSNPLDFSSTAEQSTVGYKRVEVIKGSLAHNLGKQVYEYTGADEGYLDTDPLIYPYFPKLSKNWAAGLPKRILVYDSLNRLIQQTCNTFDLFPSTEVGDSNFRSLKHTKLIFGNVSGTGLAKVKYYTGTFYYPQIGIPLLTASTDTFYHPDASITTSRQQMVYDAFFNVKKVITDYDKTRGLSLEKRMYYTYDYFLKKGTTLAKLKSDSIGIPVSNETWITGDGNSRIVAGNITSFTTFGFGVGMTSRVRPTSQYVLQSNRPLPVATIGLFDSSVLVRNAVYFIPKDSTTWDPSYYLPIESVDKQTGFTNSIMMSYNNRWPVAKVSNASFSDISYNSFETTDAGSWSLPVYTPDKNYSITGKSSFPMSAGTISRTGLTSATNYYLTFWAKAGSSISVSAGTPLLTDTQNGWNFYILNFTGYSTIYISGTGWLDELRLHPKNANMMTYTYNSLGQVTSTCDANNSIGYNYYDSVNRIKLIRDKDLNIVKKYEYPGNVTHTSISPNWVVEVPGAYQCEQNIGGQNTGRRIQNKKDMNYYSETYNLSQYFVYDTNVAACPLPAQDCGDPRKKWLNSVCEMACREYVSSIYQRVTDPNTGFQVYKWVCTFHYKWSDNSVSPNYTENHDSACTLGVICEEL